jgi:uncharacterized protein YegJ (DUF2314 family)
MSVQRRTFGVTTYRRSLSIAAILVLACANAPAQSRDHNEIIRVPNDDRQMNAAIAQAQASLAEFLSVWRTQPPGASEFRLKVRIRQGADVEHFWVAPFRPTQNGFEGILANEPRVVKNVKNGQQIAFRREDITDWGYVRDGKQIGSFTVCVMLKTAPKDQADYYRKNYGFDC